MFSQCIYSWKIHNAAPLNVLFSCSSRWTASGGLGSTTTVSRIWSRLTKTAADSRASRPWTTPPRPPAGLCLGQTNKGSTRPTRASSGATKPKISPGADSEDDSEFKETVKMNISFIVQLVSLTCSVRIFKCICIVAEWAEKLPFYCFFFLNGCTYTLQFLIFLISRC